MCFTLELVVLTDDCGKAEVGQLDIELVVEQNILRLIKIQRNITGFPLHRAP